MHLPEFQGPSDKPSNVLPKINIWFLRMKFKPDNKTLMHKIRNNAGIPDKSLNQLLLLTSFPLKNVKQLYGLKFWI
jgi:hypothetical protein